MRPATRRTRLYEDSHVDASFETMVVDPIFAAPRGKPSGLLDEFDMGLEPIFMLDETGIPYPSK